MPETLAESPLPSPAGVAALRQLVWPAGRAGPGRIAVIGCSKNAGKTTALLALMAAARQVRGPCAAVSLGLDGEARDVWGDFAKPPIWLEKDDWCATALPMAAQAGPALHVAGELPFATALGPTVLARAHAPLRVQLAGIASRSQLAAAVGALQQHCPTVAVDGAYHRQAAAHPDICDATLAAAGAIAGDTAAEALAASAPTLRALLAPHSALPATHGGAITDERVATAPGSAFVARDPSRILLTQAGWRRLAAGGGSAAVAEAVPLLAVAANPFRPDGGGENPAAFLRALRQLLDGIAPAAPPAIDVVAGQFLAR